MSGVSGWESCVSGCLESSHACLDYHDPGMRGGGCNLSPLYLPRSISLCVRPSSQASYSIMTTWMTLWWPLRHRPVCLPPPPLPRHVIQVRSLWSQDVTGPCIDRINKRPVFTPPPPLFNNLQLSFEHHLVRASETTVNSSSKNAVKILHCTNFIYNGQLIF